MASSHVPRARVGPRRARLTPATSPRGPRPSRAARGLLRPPPGQIVSRRFTQRNLYSTLKYLDRTSPDNSPLVLLPQQRHGNSFAAVFDKHSSNQLAELAAWARGQLKLRRGLIELALRKQIEAAQKRGRRLIARGQRF